MTVTPRLPILVALLLGFAPLAAKAARAQSEPKPDPQSVRDRFNQLTEEEQRRVMDNYDRWKRLSQDDRSLMKRRFEKLETERGRVRDLLDEQDRGALDGMRDRDRRSELTRRAKDALRQRFERLPPELRDRIKHELRSLPPAERERRIRQFVKQHVEGEVVERLRHKVEDGELPRESVDELRRQMQEKEGEPRARLELLRRFLVDHPDAFHLTPEMQERVKNARDPAFGLHLLDRLRRNRPPPDERAPPRPRPPPREGGRPRGV